MRAEGRTKGVSLGPHMSASQVKKSDSEMGPGQGELVTGVPSGDPPAVNMPSGEPEAH